MGLIIVVIIKLQQYFDALFKKQNEFASAI